MERRTDGQKDKRDGRTRGHVCLWCVCLFVCLFVCSFVCLFLPCGGRVRGRRVRGRCGRCRRVRGGRVRVRVRGGRSRGGRGRRQQTNTIRFGPQHDRLYVLFCSVLFCSFLSVCVCVCVVFLFRFFVREIVSRLQRALQTNTLGIVHTEADPA